MELHGQVSDASTEPPKNCAPTETTVTLDQITFAQIKSEVIDPQCLRCHNPSRPSGGIDLSTYAAVKSRLSQIDFAISRNLMPPSGPLDPTKKGLVADWIKAGAINEAEVICSEDTIPPAPPSDDQTPIPTPTNPVVDIPPTSPSDVMPADSELTFAFIKSNILDLRCVSCHSDAGGNRGGLNLERYSEVVVELADILEEVEEGNMPPPPRPALSDLQKEMMVRWAFLGAPQ